MFTACYLILTLLILWSYRKVSAGNNLAVDATATHDAKMFCRD